MEPELYRLHPDPSILRVIAQPVAKLHELALLPTEVRYQGKPITELENIYKNFIKITFGLKRQTSNLAVYGKMGRYPLEIRQMGLFLKYWPHIISLNKSDRLFKINNELLKLYKLKYKNWVGILSGVLEKIDHAELLERELPLKQNDVDTIAST